MDALIPALQEYGLTPKESKIYITALPLGSAPASSVARNSHEKKSTVYSVLKELVKKGLASETRKGNSTYFTMISPELILSKLEKKYTHFKDKMPELMALMQNMGPTPKVQFFEGIDGIKSVYEDLLQSEAEILSFLGVEYSNAQLLDYLYKDFLVRRVQKNIHAKVILSGGPKNAYYASIDKKGKKHSKLIDAKYFTIDGEINLYGPDKVSISLSHDSEMSGMIIKSQKLYTTLVSIFQFIWNHA